MALPQTNREVYRRNPLAEVIVQLRFPPILRIEAEPPAQFQEAIRDRYPRYRQIVPAGQIPSDVPAPVRNLIQSMGAAAGPSQHVFETEDQKASLTLSRESIALKTTAYTRWEQFFGQVERVRRYIRNQEEHHRKISFEEEFKALLKAHRVEFDEAYLWR